MNIFSILIYQPIYNALIYLYNLCGDFGIAIIIITILIKLALIPLSKKQITAQNKMQKMQPELKKIQKKYKDNKEEMTKQTMQLYKTHKINPASGCLPLIIQMVIFITMYRVIINLFFNHTITVDNNQLYSFITAPEKISNLFFGALNLAEPYWALALLTAIAQFYQVKMMQQTTPAKKPEKKEPSSTPDFSEIMQKQMLIVFPVMTLIIGLKFPSGLALYWLTSTAFMIAQQWIVIYKDKQKNGTAVKSIKH